MKILLSLYSPPSAGTFGSLTRVLALGEAAIARGHSIAFCATGALGARLTALGHPVFDVPEPTFLGLPKWMSAILERRAQNASPPVRPGKSFGHIWLLLMFTGLAKHSFLSSLVDAELAAVDKFAPDLLFTEVDPAAFLVARIKGLPLACTYGSPMKPGVGTFAWNRVRAAENRVLRAHGLPPSTPDEILTDERVLKLIPSIAELERDIPDRPDYPFVGPLYASMRSQSDQKFVPEPGKRYVFAYVGTGSVRLNLLRSVLPELFPAGTDTICLVASQGIAAEERMGNVIFRPFWDADNLLPHCDWVLCHGGHNTLIQSLVCGVPLLVFPGPIFERRFNAEMIQAAGAGHFGEVTDFTVPWLRNAMAQRDVCAARARELGRELQARGGATKAVELMEQWASRSGDLVDKRLRGGG